jgi:hypothetical protein
MGCILVERVVKISLFNFILFWKNKPKTTPFMLFAWEWVKHISIWNYPNDKFQEDKLLTYICPTKTKSNESSSLELNYQLNKFVKFMFKSWINIIFFLYMQ